MIDLGLTRLEEQLVFDALHDSHRMRVRVSLADTNERVVESLTSPASFVLDGAVQVDAAADVTRSLNLTLLDPGNKLGFTPNSPAQGSLGLDRFAIVHRGVWVDQLEDWIDIPVFTGPMTRYEQSGAVITMEAKGKEALMLAPNNVVQAYSLLKGSRLDDSIRRVGHRAGERRFSLPKLKTRLEKDRTVEQGAEGWRVIKGGASDVNGKKVAGLVELGDAERQAFFNGRGRLVVRRKHRNAVYTVRPRSMTEWPSVAYDHEEFRNHAIVNGQKPKGAKHQLKGVASLPPHHPLSPKALARNGEPQYRTEFADASLDKQAAIDKRADEILERVSKAGVDVSVSCLPVAMLEEDDVVRFMVGEYHLEMPISQFTIPLTCSAAMTLGETRRVPSAGRGGGGNKATAGPGGPGGEGTGVG